MRTNKFAELHHLMRKRQALIASADEIYNSWELDESAQWLAYTVLTHQADALLTVIMSYQYAHPRVYQAVVDALNPADDPYSDGSWTHRHDKTPQVNMEYSPFYRTAYWFELARWHTVGGDYKRARGVLS